MTRMIAGHKAADVLRKPGRRLMKMHTNTPEGTQWFIVPDGPVSEATALTLIKQRDVIACEDGLFPGVSQSWVIGRRK